MGIIAAIFLGILVIGGGLNRSSDDTTKETTQVIANKSKEIKPIKEEIKPEPIKEEIKPEPIKEEVKPEPVREEIKPEPIKEEIKSEPVKEEVKPEPIKEETSYFRLILYIIGIILLALSGWYFFSNRRSSGSAINTVDNDKKDIEEKIQTENQEYQSTEEPTQEEPTQEETQEPRTSEEDENNNK